MYDTLSGELLQELRRGADKAEVYSIAFNAGSSMLACTSDKGTVHVFRLKESVHDTGLPAAAAAAGAAAATVAAAAAAASPPPGATAAGSGAAPTAPAAAAPLGVTGGGARSGVAAPPAAGAAAVSGTGAASGDADTVYFGAGGAGGGAASGESNTKSSLSFIRGILPKYFSSEWSFAQFRVPDTRSICSFGQEPNTIIGQCGSGGRGRVAVAVQPQTPAQRSDRRRRVLLQGQL